MTENQNEQKQPSLLQEIIETVLTFIVIGVILAVLGKYLI